MTDRAVTMSWKMWKRESPVGGDTPADPLVFPTEESQSEPRVEDLRGPDSDALRGSDPEVQGPDAPNPVAPGPDVPGPDALESDVPGSDALESDVPASDALEPDAPEPDVEIVDGFPVLAEVRAVDRPTSAALPAVQVAAVAATGFVAGAATVALVKRRTARKVARTTRSGARRPADLLPIAASRSFLVDVHVLAKPE